MAQELCPICKGFGKVHPVIYPEPPPVPGTEKPETNPDIQNSCTLNADRDKPDEVQRGGKTDWSSLVFCICQGDKAGKVAHPRVKHPDIDTGLAEERVYDAYDADKQARFRKDTAFRQSVKELFGPRLNDGVPPEENPRNEGKWIGRKDGAKAEDIVVRWMIKKLNKEITDIRLKINEIMKDEDFSRPDKGYELPKDIQDNQEN